MADRALCRPSCRALALLAAAALVAGCAGPRAPSMIADSGLPPPPAAPVVSTPSHPPAPTPPPTTMPTVPAPPRERTGPSARQSPPLTSTPDQAREPSLAPPVTLSPSRPESPLPPVALGVVPYRPGAPSVVGDGWIERPGDTESPQVRIYNSTGNPLMLELRQGYQVMRWEIHDRVYRTLMPGEYRYTLRGSLFRATGKPDAVGTLRVRRWKLYELEVYLARGSETFRGDLGDDP